MRGAVMQIRIMRYITVGLVANLVGYGLFLILLNIGMPPVPASGTSFVVVVSATYLANRSSVVGPSATSVTTVRICRDTCWFMVQVFGLLCFRCTCFLYFCIPRLPRLS
ncbi:GtrA family protein [Marimonas sp. MJW-29]|uniref:GtrA family protein n=1 Tax=Sulfitobacter sediminis TaxID=3234186 RepID=A0ABV3RN17_9RHOB